MAFTWKKKRKKRKNKKEKERKNYGSMTSEGKKYVSIKKKDFTSPFPASMQTYGVMQPNINYLNSANLTLKHRS